MGKSPQFVIKKVLIVEDDVLLSIVTQRFVQKMGHRVIASVNNGQSAVEEVENNQPDVILMDIGLKGKWNGIETMQQIRNYSSVPVIYLSGSTGPAFEKRAEEVGFARYLKKPISMDDLSETFQELFEDEKVVHSSDKRVAG